MARLHRVLATLALLVAATALCATPALARKRDHDKLPDRWERKFHLNTNRNDANRDRDRDGLSNYREYRSHTNPRKKDTDRDGLKDGAERRFGFKPRDRDSDDDGIRDGKENAGKITALTSSSITIRLAAGAKLNAGLAADCSGRDSSGAPDTGDDPGESPADEPETDDSSPDDPGDDPETDGDDGDDLSATAAQDDDPSEDDPPLDDAEFDKQFDAEFADGQTCDASSLKRGSLVHEATVDRSGPSPVVTAVTLVRR
jgi:hypothetical protein